MIKEVIGLFSALVEASRKTVFPGPFFTEENRKSGLVSFSCLGIKATAARERTKSIIMSTSLT